MNISLENRTAVICGCTRGIGLAIARELASNGASCILLARNEKSLAKLVDLLARSADQRHRYYVADFSIPDEVKKAIEMAVSESTVHILVNNTGGPPPGPIEKSTTEEFKAAFEQHLINNHLLATAVLPGMKKSGYGRIINIISTSVKIPIPDLGVSNTVRAATASWAKTLSLEVARFGITVNNILPGFTWTKRLEDIIDEKAAAAKVTPGEISRRMELQIPAGRFGEPAEIAAAAAFLASPSASYINGISLPVDGGRTGSI